MGSYDDGRDFQAEKQQRAQAEWYEGMTPAQRICWHAARDEAKAEVLVHGKFKVWARELIRGVGNWVRRLGAKLRLWWDRCSGNTPGIHGQEWTVDRKRMMENGGRNEEWQGYNDLAEVPGWMQERVGGISTDWGSSGKKREAGNKTPRGTDRGGGASSRPGRIGNVSPNIRQPKAR